MAHPIRERGPSGALTEEEFLASLERAGFYGVQVLRKTFWREVEGHRFHSLTVRGFKYEKQERCVYRGQVAVYKGPYCQKLLAAAISREQNAVTHIAVRVKEWRHESPAHLAPAGVG